MQNPPPPIDPNDAPVTTFRDDLAPITCPTCQKPPVAVTGGQYTCHHGHTWTPVERSVRGR